MVTGQRMARGSLDRHATYIVAAYIAGAVTDCRLKQALTA
jgi:hypothetical protein